MIISAKDLWFFKCLDSEYAALLHLLFAEKRLRGTEHLSITHRIRIHTEVQWGVPTPLS